MCIFTVHSACLYCQFKMKENAVQLNYFVITPTKLSSMRNLSLVPVMTENPELGRKHKDP